MLRKEKINEPEVVMPNPMTSGTFLHQSSCGILAAPRACRVGREGTGCRSDTTFPGRHTTLLPVDLLVVIQQGRETPASRGSNISSGSARW